VRLLATDLTEPLAYDLALAYADVNPNVLVNPSLDTPDRLAAELRAGRAELALTITPDPALFGTPVGNLPLHIVTHPDSPIPSLTVAQAQDIFAGRLTQWSDVSAEQGDIYLAVRAAGSPAADFFLAQLWGDPPPEGAAVTPAARLAPTWGAMRELVGGNPGGLGYLIGPELASSVRPLPLLTAEGQPAEFSALIVALALADPSGPVRDFLAWVQSPAGQAVVATRHAPLEP
jgi:ABC-type phosphate transport system substrate-binding protein